MARRQKSFNDIMEQRNRIINELRSRQAALPNRIENGQQARDYAEAESRIRKVEAIAARYGNRIANTKSFQNATGEASDAYLGRSVNDGRAEHDRIIDQRNNRKYSQSTYMGNSNG